MRALRVPVYDSGVATDEDVASLISYESISSARKDLQVRFCQHDRSVAHAAMLARLSCVLRKLGGDAHFSMSPPAAL
jgi:hypothetical protein